MKRYFGVFFGVVVLLIALLVYRSVYQIQVYEKGVVFAFREAIKIEDDPGIHFLIPFIQDVVKFDTRILTLVKYEQRFLTNEKKDVLVDYYVKWRISDAMQFYSSSRSGSIQYASNLIEQQVNRALRDEFGKRTIQDVVAGDRESLLDFVTEGTANLTRELGINVIDIRTIRIDLPNEVSKSVYERMKAERLRVAKEFRAQGNEAAERIRASADKDFTVIVANAKKEAELIRSSGEAKAAHIYSSAYKQDPDFYSFFRSLQAYQNSFDGSAQDYLVLDANSEFFRFLNDSKGTFPKP